MKVLPSLSGHYARIAVIDSDELYLNKLRNLLVLGGYRYTYATKCEIGATMLIEQNKIDIILIEINDRYVSCWEILQSDNRAFVVAMTHERDGALWKSVIKKGADIVISKQAMPTVLLPLLLEAGQKKTPRSAAVIQFPHSQEK